MFQRAIHYTHEYSKFVSNLYIVGMLGSEIASVNNKWQKIQENIMKFSNEMITFQVLRQRKQELCSKHFHSESTVESIFTLNNNIFLV